MPDETTVLDGIAAILRRAVRDAIGAGLEDRKGRREMAEAWDLRMKQLSAAQLITEKKLQGLIESLRLGSNRRLQVQC